VAALALMNRVYREFKYVSGSTTISTTVQDVMNTRQGVCQDFAHVMIGVLRSLGLSACYVSGYMLTDPPPGQPKLMGADASHAWVSLWCGNELGWVDFDPTNNQIPDLRYVTVAVGRDYADVPPLKGVVHGGTNHTLSVAVTVL
ncbi:MAG: transglutaminase family protein, partial [Limnobacter sp.]|nr:transglutaminase family protein [Limnobacter sp.]